MIIPMSPSRAFFKFRVVLSERLFQFTVKWSTRFGFYTVDIYEGTTSVILGRGLHPGVDILYGLNLGIGSLYLDGEVATVENLGISNKLRYDPL